MDKITCKKATEIVPKNLECTIFNVKTRLMTKTDILKWNDSLYGKAKTPGVETIEF